MKRRSLPLWLLRDVPAFLGVMFSFWPLMILVIVNGRRAASGKKVRQSSYIDFAILLAHAEARLAFALWRQAYRRLGWNPRGVIFTLVPASDNFDETVARYHAYSRACREMAAYVDAYVEDLRQQYNISQHDAANARGCPLRRAARVAYPTRCSLSSLAERRGRWIAASSRRDGGGSLNCRGPPIAHCLLPTAFQPTSHVPRARSQPHAPQKSARTATRKLRPAIGAISFSGEVCRRTSSSVRFLPSSIR